MSLTLGLSTALSGLSTSQKGLDLTSHNIVNRDTEGFTRKIFTTESRVLTGRGVGVQASQTQRIVDDGLRKGLRESKGLLAQYVTTSDYMGRISDLFGRPQDNSSFAHSITQLGNEFTTLGLDSHSSSQSDVVISEAARLTERLNKISTQIQQERTNADQQIQASITEVNTYLKDLASLNEKLVLARATGVGEADLQDKRDLLLDKISSIMDINHYVGENGATVVFTASGSILLDNLPRDLKHASIPSVTANDTYASGSFDGIYAGATDITKDIRSGKLAALIETRDKTLTNLQGQMDEMTRVLRTELNAVHNRGTSFPALATEMHGTRTFVDPASQTISLSSGDTAITLFNKDGTQAKTTTLSAVMGGGTGPWTVNAVAAGLQTWLQTAPGPGLATVAINSEGKMDISLKSSEYSLAFRDQKTGNLGDAAQDAKIGFDSNGDGSIDQTVDGFSNFFGLNDFFGSLQVNHSWDSTPSTTSSSVVSGFTMAFSNQALGVDFGHLTVASGDTLASIAKKINNDPTLNDKIRASVIPDGELQKLRITTLDNKTLEISMTSGSATGFSLLGLAPSATGESANLVIASDLTQNHDRIAKGAVQYNQATGKYTLSNADNTNANKLSEVFTKSQSYLTAGGLSTGDMRLSDYAASIISSASSEAAAVKSSTTYQSGLVQTLVAKDGDTSGVNMDEELSKLMVFEQSYAASAKVISTIQKMLETLTDMIR